MLVIKSIDVFPSKNIQPDDALIIRMEVENAGQESAYLLVDKDANTRGTSLAANLFWNGDYLLIDHCSSLYNAKSKDADFQILSGGSCISLKDMYAESDTEYAAPLIPLVKDSDGNGIGVLRNGQNEVINDAATGKPITACYLKIPSGQSHTFQWSMKAPSSDKIASMTNKCEFKFQIAYASKAVTNTYVYFADPIEVAQRMYAQKDMTQAGDNIASYGPVAVNFAPAEPQPIPARKNSDWTVFINVKNVGAGIATVNDIGFGYADSIKLVGSAFLGCGGLKNVADSSRLLAALKEYGIPDNTEFNGALNTGLWCNASMNANDVNCKRVIEAYPDIVPLTKKYSDLLCQKTVTGAPIEPDPVCGMTFSDVVSAFEDTKRLLQIYSQTTSRIPCELTIPEGVTILSPFRFVTTADYTYSIRQDIQITTKPIRERA